MWGILAYMASNLVVCYFRGHWHGDVAIKLLDMGNDSDNQAQLAAFRLEVRITTLLFSGNCNAGGLSGRGLREGTCLKNANLCINLIIILDFLGWNESMLTFYVILNYVQNNI